MYVDDKEAVKFLMNATNHLKDDGYIEVKKTFKKGNDVDQPRNLAKSVTVE